MAHKFYKIEYRMERLKKDRNIYVTALFDSSSQTGICSKRRERWGAYAAVDTISQSSPNSSYLQAAVRNYEDGRPVEEFRPPAHMHGWHLEDIRFLENLKIENFQALLRDVRLLQNVLIPRR